MPSDADSSSSPDTAPVVNFRLPAFSSIDAAIWFRRAEVQFRLKNVRNSHIQADHVLAALPDALFPQMAQWLDSKGDVPIEYNDLKAFLLRKFSLSPEQRVNSIFSLQQQPLGDQRPSDALTELRALSRLPPDSSGDSKTIDVLLAIWLQRLPEPIRAAITDFADYHNDASIADYADSLLDAHRAASKTPIAATTEEDDDHDPPDAVALATAPRRRPPRQQRPPVLSKPPAFSSSSPSPSRLRKSDFAARLCFYHARFGHKANKCEAPCSWSKNAL